MDSHSRQEYVRAAVSFLQNPKLVDSSLKDKLKFLRDKGLSDLEVDEALNLALVSRNQSQSGKWNFILILGLCIGGYKLYQAYLEQKARKIEGDQKEGEQSRTGDQKLVANSSRHQDVSELDSNHPTLNEILQKMSELKKLVELQRSNFGTEMQSLKTLLLGHEKFAAPPKIPEWQLPSIDEESTRETTAIQTSSKPEITSNAKKNGIDKKKNETDKKVDKKKTKHSDTSKTSSSTNGAIEPVLLTASVGPNPE